MDVTCTRCGTVYEFEEGLISTTGTTVKCTQCGHLFKVHRPAAGSSPPAPDESEARELRWRVRRVNGSAHTLETLAELTRLITAGQFARDDEISRTGQVWKKLGDIQELASLFEPPTSVRPRRQSDFAPAPPPPPQDEEPSRPSTSPLPPPPPLPVDVQSAARSRVRTAERFQVMGADIALDAQESDATRPLARSELVGADPTPAAAPPARSDPPSGPAQTRHVQSTPPRPPRALTAAAHEVDDLEAPLRARSRFGVWLVFGITVATAAGIAAVVLRPGATPQPDPELPVRAHLQRGDEALASHLPARFDAAIAEYTKALAFHEDDAHILSSISRVYAVWSQWLNFRIRALTDTGSSAQAEIDALRNEARRIADQAKIYGERAAQRNPGNEEAGVALSDALRLTSNLVAARAELDRARATEGVAPAETLRVAALLAIDEANGDFRVGRSLAEQAVARDPGMLRARTLLARCLIADGDVEGARMHLDAAGASERHHPVIDAVRAEIARLQRASKPPREAQAADAKPDVPQAQTRPAPPKPADAKPSEPTPGDTKHGDTKSGDTKSGDRGASSRDPDELAQKGEVALERGAVQQAQRLFEEALDLEPGMPRARTGLGYVALERSQPRLAVNYFRPAAKSGNPEALIGLGDAYRRLGRVRDALAAYKEYLQRYPRGERRSIAQRQVELLTEQLESNP
jgi:predicted Zn finger-like uncharacterized protein